MVKEMRGETDKYINIHALSKGDQLLLCKHSRGGMPRHVFLWSTPRNDPYKLSEFGKKYQQKLPNIERFEHKYVAEVEYYCIDGNNKEFWEELAKIGEFNLWNFENGPLKYYEFKPKNIHRLAFYAVDEINVTITRDDIEGYPPLPPHNSKRLSSAGINKVIYATSECIFGKYHPEDDIWKRRDEIQKLVDDFFGTDYSGKNFGDF